ncbi:13645_t:CDS:1, partial [Racocetra fulgida]
MDEEARKKFCHLLMFDVDVHEQEQDAISTNENLNGIDNDPHHFAYHYDNGSTTFNPSHAHNIHNIIEPSVLDVSNSSVPPTVMDSSTVQTVIPVTRSIKSTKARKPRARKPKRTPRPPNAFILYRKNKQPDVVAQDKSLTNAEVSKVISKMWWKESEEVRFQWEKLADRMKLKHMQDHPDYVYQPKKPGTKKPRKLSKGRDCNSSTNTFPAIPSSDKN